MPIVRIEFDDQKLNDEQIGLLSKASQKIVAEITAAETDFVYANSALIKSMASPIEIFVEISDFKVKDLNSLTEQIAQALKAWKDETGFDVPMNLTVTPMPWRVVKGI